MSHYTEDFLQAVWELARRAKAEGMADPVVTATGPHARCDHGLTDCLPPPAAGWMAATVTDRWGDAIALRAIERADLDAAVAAAGIPTPIYLEQVCGAEGPAPLGMLLDLSRDEIALAIPPVPADWGLPRASWSEPA